MVVLEQSNCFVFQGDVLVTFNDEIMVKCPNPFDFDVVVAAADLLKVLAKFPDQEVEITLNGGELVIKGKRRSAGITAQAEVLLPYTEVPGPGKWKTLKDGTTGMLKQAARTCGKDLSNPMTTVVHAAPKVIEACDNFRLFRCRRETGVPEAVLIPAFSLGALDSVALQKASVNKDWIHFKTSNDTLISVRCMIDSYLDLDPIIAQAKETERVALPSNLKELVERAQIMGETHDAVVSITIEEGMLTIRSEKEADLYRGAGWYREKKRIKYKGPKIKFQVNPKFLVEVLDRSRKVWIGNEKLKLETGEVTFVVCLEA